ncbi:hypothetical protein MPTK1_1g25790 [Marchantia polymorpha subsp. ruderalis]|uniref:Peptidase S9 prolyl oligopeptidase catalytic domain-containing protein n=2 Tax=Marchantia polymorpha TaxID=3197 RepID=A0AAF6AUA0_MARPO|nr:hypothetical protein MARPO_0002s0297 [Marchantia polymorpha]BBN00021.1 hypothetical protein Mp_1g25790 [Marchantia polymorpha subsp. ruderalis]|eukprot:PTQ49862.1 hypothetical protein MARPO_0002s0297 [Marchantia polymorpha]
MRLAGLSLGLGLGGFRASSSASSRSTVSACNDLTSRRLLYSDGHCSLLGNRGLKPRLSVGSCAISVRASGTSTVRSGSGSRDGEKMAPNQEQIEAAFGSWRSPVTADLVSGTTKQFGGSALDSHGRLIWCEGRPWQKGRYVLVREGSDSGGAAEDLTPAGFSVRTVVHEYGGGAFTISDDLIVFSNYEDQRLYKQALDGDRTPVALTPDYGERRVRYADGVVDKSNGLYITVREDERMRGKEATNEIVVVQLSGDSSAEPKVLLSGNDFYAYPRLSPDGKKISWMEWSHPNMPWDRASIWVGDISSHGDVVNRTCVAGGDEEIMEAPSEPRWSPEGDLYFVSDRGSGWWNLYRWGIDTKVEALYPLEAEFTRPLWNFGNTNFAFVRSKEASLQNKIVCTYRQRGMSHLGLFDVSTRTFSKIETPFCDIFGLMTEGEYVYITAGSTLCPLSVAKVNLLENEKGEYGYSVPWTSFEVDIENYRSYISVPQVVEFQTNVEGDTAFANFYPPTNPDYKPLAGEKPPLLVRSHGGPTSEAKITLNFSIQYWTSRGWAFADVNYSGSTGYGREYRERLRGQWGIRDVGDCCSCAEFLAEKGMVDGKRLCIDGRSAGGYTTIASMVFANTFAAGCSLFGLSQLADFGDETHKFESRYVQALTGGDKDKDALYNRSPINFVKNWSCPIILFQGLEDKVVPPNQARIIYEAVKAKGLPVALVEYEGEQHGFLKAENIKHQLEQEMTFFARLIGGFKMAEEVTPLRIENYDD